MRVTATWRARSRRVDLCSSEAAESELYRRFAPRVRLYGLRHLRDEDAARGWSSR